MKKNIKLLIAVLLVSVITLGLVACGEKENLLVGTWKNDELGFDFIYTFKEDGTGNYNSAGADMPFTYKTKGNKISILYDGDDVSFDTTFEANENSINIKDSNGFDTIYKKYDPNEEREAFAVSKEDEVGTAGSNIPLKDNHDAAQYQIELAFEKWIDETYGDSIYDSRINMVKVYTVEDEQSEEGLRDLNLTVDEIAFEVAYDLKPASDDDITRLTIPNGEYSEERGGWVVDKTNLGILKPSEESDTGYVVTHIGTGW